MKCDNCGQTAGVTHQRNRIVWKTQFGFPPIYRVIEEEMWCRKCHDVVPSQAKKRRKLEIKE